MCGINGIVSLGKEKSYFSNGPVESLLGSMNDAIAHRGPDSDGIFVEYPVGLGFRRLSIIDLRETANQPMISTNKELVMVFNGEIYNYIEIRETLIAKGYEFRTDSDTEVIIKSYLEYREKCVEHFNGMWSLVIFDRKNQKLFCSRDRMGVKPFYYCIKDQLLYFSSELKSLHAALPMDKANLGKVYDYLAYGFRNNDGETFFEDCYELQPGTNLLVEGDKVTFHKYWELKENAYQHDSSLSYHEEYAALFESAVKLRYRSDVPVALLLSGGLDSTAIAKVTDNLIQQGGLKQGEIQAFIASFPGFKEDETAIAREFVSTCKNIRLHEMQIDTEGTLSNLENIIYALDHPVFSFNVVVHQNIMKACKEKGIKVMLNGQGSDEAYAGYDRYISGVFLVDQFLARNKNFFKEFMALNKLNHYSAKFLISQMLKTTINQSFSAYLRARFQEKTLPCLNDQFVQENYSHYNPAYQFSWRGNNFNNYLLKQIKQEGLNQILHYEDVSSMSQSIEIRSPFMDYRLMEFAFSIPKELKFKEGVTKLIQRETIGKMLPDSITKNRQKIGFRTPFLEYISDNPAFSAYVAELINTPEFNQKKIWKADKIRDMFKKPMENPNFPFWRIINLEVWSKLYKISNLYLLLGFMFFRNFVIKYVEPIKSWAFNEAEFDFLTELALFEPTLMML